MKIHQRERPSASWTALYEVDGEWIGDVVNSFAPDIIRAVNSYDALVAEVARLQVALQQIVTESNSLPHRWQRHVAIMGGLARKALEQTEKTE